MIRSLNSALGLGLFLVIFLKGTAGFGQFQLDLQEVVSGLRFPTFVTHAGDGTGRMFICEQRGKIRILERSGLLREDSFLDLGPSGLNLVSQTGEETGLLSLAFHPDYAKPKSVGFRRFYVFYTTRDTKKPVVAQYLVSADPNIAESTETRILGPLFHPGSVHFGGALAFNPHDTRRSCLYVTRGDGGIYLDPEGNAQDYGNQLGAILRIDVDTASEGRNYGIPPDNPFVGREGLDEIWAYGFRNPWRLSFDRVTGRGFVADVGQDRWEEIDELIKGGNYGWNRREGNHCHPSETDDCLTDKFLPPIAEYPHSEGIAVIGGYVYRGELFPSMHGRYFFGDFVSGRIWSLKETGHGDWSNRLELIHPPFSVSSFAEDEQGELYLVRYTGSLYRFVNLAAKIQPGDLNINRRVGPLDLMEFLQQAQGKPPTPGHRSADVNGDGRIDLLDSLEIQRNWKTASPASG